MEDQLFTTRPVSGSADPIRDIEEALAARKASKEEERRRRAEQPGAAFVDLAASTGRVYAHQTTAARLRDAIVGDASLAGIEIVEDPWIDPGVLMAFRAGLRDGSPRLDAPPPREVE
ncbi:MAG: hypothetical protein RIS45_244 [Planctomycetota bacterium]